MDSGESVIDGERPGGPAPAPKKSASRLRRQGILAAVGLGAVYLLIAVAFLHEGDLDTSPFSDSRGPVSAPPHTVEAAVEPEEPAASEWRPPGVPLLLQVPSGWQRQVVGNALVLTPTEAADDLVVRLYYERGDRSLADTARSAADYLNGVAGDAAVSKPVITAMAGRRAMSVRAETEQAVHRATVWILDGVRYLVVEQLRRSAKPELKA
jgi:hypothetical protein